MNNPRKGTVLKAFLIAVLILFPFSFASGEWFYLTTNKAGDKIYFDPEKTERESEKNLKAWMKAEFKNLILFGEKYATYMHYYVEFECDPYRYKFLQVTPHFKDGEQVTYTYPQNKWVQIAPGSNFEPIGIAICHLAGN